MKKIISLGGNVFQKSAVMAAKRLGYYVIDVDYLPDNPAHKYSDEYYNISITEKEEILKLAKSKQVDGIISFASDVGAPTAAFVAERMGLPTNPYKSVEIMTRKDLFHPYLKQNGFYVPRNIIVKEFESLFNFFDEERDIIIKPISSSGSKGVTRVRDESELLGAFNEAKKYSGGKDIVAEKFIERKGYQIAGDAFLVNGEIKYFGIANEHFDESINGLVPVGESFPAILDDTHIIKAKNEIQRALSLLEMKNGPINLDFMFDKNDNVVILELGPRAGGNYIADAITLSSGVDLIEYAVKASVGEDISDLEDKPIEKNYSTYIWHTNKNGVYEDIVFSDILKEKIVKSEMYVEKGHNVYPFINGGYGLGAAILKYDSKEEMVDMMNNMSKYYSVIC